MRGEGESGGEIHFCSYIFLHRDDHGAASPRVGVPLRTHLYDLSKLETTMLFEQKHP